MYQTTYRSYTINQTDLIHKALDHYGFICLPQLDSPPEQSGLVPIIKMLQPPALIKFDSFDRVSKSGSIIDFVIRKGQQELLVGVWPNGYTITPDQQQRIESAGRSYVAILGEWIDRSNVKQALEQGVITAETTGLGETVLHTSYWVYHARHGWYYDTENNKVRV